MKYLLAFSASALFASAYDYVVVGSVEEDTFTVISKNDLSDFLLSNMDMNVLNKAPRYKVVRRVEPDDYKAIYQLVCRDDTIRTIGTIGTKSIGKNNIMCPERISCTKMEYDISPFSEDEWCYLRPDTFMDIHLYIGMQSSKQDKINITEKILFEMTLGIYRLSKVGEYDPIVASSGSGGGDVVGTYTRPGFAHCDINPNNLLINYYQSSLKELVLTGYLGKQKLNDNNTYSFRMDACNGSGDVKYFSPRRTALHMAKLVKNNKELNKSQEELQDATNVADAIEKEYKNYHFQMIPLATEDDLWSGLLSLYEMCYPLKTLESYVEEKGIDHECTDDFVETLGVDKSVCLKGLFYNKLKNGNQTLPTYVYKGVNFKDYFNFDEKCTFPELIDNIFEYHDIVEDSSDDESLRENLKKYLRVLTTDDSFLWGNLVVQFKSVIRSRESGGVSNQPSGYDETG
eukprot:GHVR01067298.1.p1 GENE.GHVR01067298.1~~GHVR01067298.1.p1  ORF type:complete len:470 (-),score=94.87 GHVR01067298.1:272-1645(-)